VHRVVDGGREPVQAAETPHLADQARQVTDANLNAAMDKLAAAWTI